ncbi:hypothetical protein CUMW_269110 [Citrus unshiu]|uniref:30S ribosomal protein S8, chloroplastic n=1 Tax=Citrus unshiu TaxID=55188 RepID=A0A2H5QWS2_CITUN|nr:hypothetical protein CUMW_269110 [Citrus unshiu]
MALPLPVAGAAAAAVSPSPSTIPREESVAAAIVEVQTVMGRRILNDALRAIVNAERRGKATVELQPISTVMSSFLNIMKYRGYIKDFQLYDPHRVGKIKVELLGRADVKGKEIEGYTVRALPTRQWAMLLDNKNSGWVCFGSLKRLVYFH